MRHPSSWRRSLKAFWKGAALPADPCGPSLLPRLHLPKAVRPAQSRPVIEAECALQPHGYIQTTSPDYILTLLSRGTTAACRAGEIGLMLVDGFEREAELRIASGTFYGALLFLSLTARKTKIANPLPCV
jgi:hypothetical protein